MKNIVSGVAVTLCSSGILGLCLFFYYIDSSINKIYVELEQAGKHSAYEVVKTRDAIITLTEKVNRLEDAVLVIDQNYVSLETLKRIELFLNNFTLKSQALYSSIDRTLKGIEGEATK